MLLLFPAVAISRQQGDSCSTWHSAMGADRLTESVQQIKEDVFRVTAVKPRVAGWKRWMGDVDVGANVPRSVFLGDRVNGAFTVYVGFASIRFNF